MDQFAKKKFFDEVDSLTRLKHPNIVSLKDWGIENGSNQLYLVMDYVDGETMRQLINRKNYLTWAEAKVIFLDLVEALYVCHQANIIHKDIKPDNIVLRKNPKNQPILIDFGIANIRPISVSTRTKTKHIVGSDLYMSPEQKSGGHLTDKTDIYSLGIC
jgi:serine/threonine protein kinase